MAENDFLGAEVRVDTLSSWCSKSMYLHYHFGMQVPLYIELLTCPVSGFTKNPITFRFPRH